MSKTRDGVTVVIPVHNAAVALDKVLPAWGTVLANANRPYEIIVVNDGSTDNTADVLQKRASMPHLRVLKHDTRQGFGACLRTALAETKQPLLLYAGVDYPYTPSDIRPMFDRIELRDEIFGKQPDLISGARAGQHRPWWVKYPGFVWKLFWRIFAGLPMMESPPWYGLSEARYRWGVHWVYGVPLADVNSAFKLWRVSFLKRFPIQSDGDFVHVELVAKATFLTSIMDEIPLTVKPDPLPPIGDVSVDRKKLFRDPKFAHEPEKPAAPPTQPEVAAMPPTPPPATTPPTPPTAETNTGGQSSPGSPVPAK